MSESFVTPWTVAHQSPPSVGFPRQEYWSGLPFPPPGDLPDPGIKAASPALAGRFYTTETPMASKQPVSLFSGPLRVTCRWTSLNHTQKIYASGVTYKGLLAPLLKIPPFLALALAGTLFPPPGITAAPLAVEAWSPNHWASGKSPNTRFRSRIVS